MTTQPTSTRRDAYPCRWDWCREVLRSEADAKSHLIETHVRTSKPVLTSDLKVWKGTDGGWYGVEKGFETLMGQPNTGGSSSLSFTLDQASHVDETHFPAARPGPSSGAPSGTPSQPSNVQQETLPTVSPVHASSAGGQTESDQVHGGSRNNGLSGEPPISSGEVSDSIKQDTSGSISAAQPSVGSFDSRPRTQVIPMDIAPDTTLESWMIHPDHHDVTMTAGDDTMDTEMEAATSEVKILSQQSGTSSTTIPDTYEHEDGPTILPPLEDEPSGVMSSPPTSAMERLKDGAQFSTFASPVRLSVPVSNLRGSIGTPDKTSQTTNLSDQMRTPVLTRFEFGSVVHTSPAGDQVVGNSSTITGDPAIEQDQKMDGEGGRGVDMSARKGPVGVGFAFGRTS